MNLFEIEEDTEHEWFDVCRHADNLDLKEEEKMLIFDVCMLYGQEWDRRRVAEALHTARTNKTYLIMVLDKTYPNNPGLQFAARELLLKVPDRLLCSVLAFSHDGSGRNWIKFPDKIQNIPLSLLKAFGLRGSESGWFDRLAADKSFVRMVSGSIESKDWKHIIHDKPTLLLKEGKEVTAPQSSQKQEGALW